MLRFLKEVIGRTCSRKAAAPILDRSDWRLLQPFSKRDYKDLDLVAGRTLVLVEGGGTLRPLPDELQNSVNVQVLVDGSQVDGETELPEILPENWVVQKAVQQFVPEYSDEERIVFEQGRAFAKACSAALVARLSEAVPDIPFADFAEPLSVVLEKWTTDRLAGLRAFELALAGGDYDSLCVVANSGRILEPLLTGTKVGLFDGPVFTANFAPQARDTAASTERTPPVTDSWAADLRSFVQSLSGSEMVDDNAGRAWIVVSAPDPNDVYCENAFAVGRKLLACRDVTIALFGHRGQKLDNLLARARDLGDDGSPFDLDIVVDKRWLRKFKDPKRRLAWRTGLQAQLLTDLRDMPGLTFIEQPLLPMVEDLVIRFVRDSLPRLLNLIVRTELTFAHRPPAYVLLCRSRAHQSRLVAASAKRHRVPTIDLEATGISSWIGHRAPVGDYFLVLDSRTRDHFVEHFGLPAERIAQVGSVRMDRIRERHSGEGPSKIRHRLKIAEETDRVVLLVTSYGRLKTYLRILDTLLEVCTTDSRIRLVVKLHPKDQENAGNPYQALASDWNLKNRCLVTATVDPYALVLAADLVVTFFSTLGYEASVLGRPVLSINYDGLPQSADHVLAGLHASVSTREEALSLIPRLLRDTPDRRATEQKRRAFLARNPQLISGSTVERVCDFCERMTSQDRLARSRLQLAPSTLTES